VKGAREQVRITLAGHTFDGPYASPKALENLPGVWAVLRQVERSLWRPVEVGSAGAVRRHVAELHRSGRWSDRWGPLGFAARYSELEMVKAAVERDVMLEYGRRPANLQEKRGPGNQAENRE
jgi:hypothetical protein